MKEEMKDLYETVTHTPMSCSVEKKGYVAYPDSPENNSDSKKKHVRLKIMLSQEIDVDYDADITLTAQTIDMMVREHLENIPSFDNWELEASIKII